jgi:hypothetical protein
MVAATLKTAGFHHADSCSRVDHAVLRSGGGGVKAHVIGSDENWPLREVKSILKDG